MPAKRVIGRLKRIHRNTLQVLEGGGYVALLETAKEPIVKIQADSLDKLLVEMTSGRDKAVFKRSDIEETVCDRGDISWSGEYNSRYVLEPLEPSEEAHVHKTLKKL